MADPAVCDSTGCLGGKNHTNSNGQSRLATDAAASNLDLYQVNYTFYDPLGRNDSNYLLARAIQFFAPGEPQVYVICQLLQKILDSMQAT